jgi:hypothetical protein
MELTFSRALKISPNDQSNIPFPNVILSDFVSGTTGTAIYDSSKNFIELGVQVGDTIMQSDSGEYAQITIVQEQYLYFNNYIFGGTGEPYKIFQGTNQGCYIIPSNDGNKLNLEIVTAAGDLAYFEQVTPGVLFPVKLLRVTPNSGVTNIIALW